MYLFFHISRVWFFILGERLLFVFSSHFLLKACVCLWRSIVQLPCQWLVWETKLRPISLRCIVSVYSPTLSWQEALWKGLTKTSMSHVAFSFYSSGCQQCMDGHARERNVQEPCKKKKKSVSGFTESLAECPWRSSPCENVSLCCINGALCRVHLSLHLGSSWCNHKRAVFMNGALTDECELTTTEERALSSPKWPGTIYITAKALASLSHVSSSCVPTPRTRICTDSFYILEVFGVLVCQRWWRPVLRWDCDKRNQWGQHPCPLWFPLWALVYLKLASKDIKMYSSTVIGH